MTPSFVRALGRLIQQISAGAANDVIGAALAAAVRHVRPRSATFQLAGDALILDGAAIADEGNAEVVALRDALIRHGVSTLLIRHGSTARELLQCCALLAASQSTGDETSIVDAASRLNFWHLAIDGAAPAQVAVSAVSAADALPVTTADDAERRCGALTDALDRAVAASDALEASKLLTQAVRTEQVAIAAAATSPSEEPTTVATHWSDCVAHGTTAPALRLIVAMVLDGGYPRDALLEVLRRAGNAGTAALMQQLTVAQSLLHRRLLFDAIVDVKVGVAVLIAHLEHKSWFVARNAACLLGALKAVEAESALISALLHPDERVRTSIATALVQLGTPNGRRALENIIRDSSSEVRRRAMRGLLSGEGLARSAAVLSDAVDLERDPDVQLEIVATLRELGTPQAVQQLARLCSPAALAGKSMAYRREAMEALVALRPALAAPLLRIQAQDRDPAVRELARWLTEFATSAA